MKIKIATFLTASLLPLGFASASDNNFYLTGTLGASVFKHHKQQNPMRGIYTGKATHKGATSAYLGFATGYYLNEIFRTQAEVSVYSQGKLESKFESKFSGSYNKVIKKYEISSIMLGGYADLFNLGSTKFFIGGKAGIASVGETITSESVIPSLPSLGKIKYKNKRSNNFAYGIVTGLTIPLSDKAKTDISLSYNDFGKSKSLIKSGDQYGKTVYKNINLEAGFRFDL